MKRLELDYYGILDIPRTAKKAEIAFAYRNLAIQLCPHRDKIHRRDFLPLANEEEPTHMAPLSAQRQWEYINMAYDVLGHDVRRAVYDQFGEAGIFHGMVLPNGYFPPYQYHGDHMKVYHEVFANYSPYGNVIDAITNPPPLVSKKHGIGVTIRNEPVEKLIPLTLEEVYKGATKLMHVWRQEFVDVAETKTERKKIVLTVIIAPGTTAGTRYTFKEQGDRAPMRIPADIIFITSDEPHPRFKRVNNHDLHVEHSIGLEEALIGFRIHVETLDLRFLTIPITDVVEPGFQKIIPGEGLPKCSLNLNPTTQLFTPKEFGNMIIEFNVIFPLYLNPEMKQMAIEYFDEMCRLDEEQHQRA